MTPVTVSILGTSGEPLITELRKIDDLLAAINYKQSIADAREELMKECVLARDEPKVLLFEAQHGEMYIHLNRNGRSGIHFSIRGDGTAFMLNAQDARRLAEFILTNNKATSTDGDISQPI